MKRRGRVLTRDPSDKRRTKREFWGGGGLDVSNVSGASTNALSAPPEYSAAYSHNVKLHVELMGEHSEHMNADTVPAGWIQKVTKGQCPAY